MKKINSIRTGYFAALVAVLILCMQFVSPTDQLQAQVGQIFPNVYSATTTQIGWTAGTVNNGGRSVAVTASSAAATAQQDDCRAPLFPECNIVWANSAGTVTVTATSAGIATASAAGNTILAYVETAALTNVISSITYPQQASIANMAQLQVYDCGIAVACTSAGAAGSLLGTGAKIAFGSADLTAGTASITGLPFTNSSSYGCTASFAATTAQAATIGVLSAVPSSGSAMSVSFNNNYSTTAVTFICIGN